MLVTLSRGKIGRRTLRDHSAGPRGQCRVLGVLPGKLSRVQVLSPQAAFIVGDILADAQARALTFGLDSVLTTRFWSAVKTGTSKDMRDNWSIGWSQRYTVGVWVGNSAGASMRDVSGVSGAGPIWHDVMSYLHRKQGSWQPTAPTSVVRRHVSFEHQIEPARDEVFIGDTALDYVQLRQEAVIATLRLKIAHPIDKTILALDPDIPAAAQRIWLQASSASADTAPLQWLIDKKVMGTGRKLAWLPWPGRHRIELVDSDGEIVDGVTIEVRGARSD